MASKENPHYVHTMTLKRLYVQTGAMLPKINIAGEEAERGSSNRSETKTLIMIVGVKHPRHNIVHTSPGN